MPINFYNLFFDDYLLLRNGFFFRREYEQQVIRKAVALIMSPWLSKTPNPSTFWPLSIDEEIRQKEVDEAISVLNYLKNNDGKFVYKKVNGVIVQELINNN